MKTRLVVAASVLIVISVIAVVILREPSDIPVVRGIKPFYTDHPDIGPDPMIERRYSVHMSYDEAVRRVNDDVPKSWTRTKWFHMALFESISNPVNSVTIERARVVTNQTLPSYVSGIPPGASVAIPFDRLGDLPSPEGWTVITTMRPATPFEQATWNIRKVLLRESQRKSAPYQYIRIDAKAAARTRTLPMSGDSSVLAGEQGEVQYFDGTH